MFPYHITCFRCLRLAHFSQNIESWAESWEVSNFRCTSAACSLCSGIQNMSAPDWCVPHNLRLVEKRQVMGRLSLEVWVLKVVDNFCLASLMWFEDTSLWSTTCKWRLKCLASTKIPSILGSRTLPINWRHSASFLVSRPFLRELNHDAEERAGHPKLSRKRNLSNLLANLTKQVSSFRAFHAVCGSLEVWEVGHVGLKRSLSIWFGGLGLVSMSAAPCAQLGEKYHELRELVVERFASSFGKSGEFTIIVEEANSKRNWSDLSAASYAMKPLEQWSKPLLVGLYRGFFCPVL